jgi:hypothetical protein
VSLDLTPRERAVIAGAAEGLTVRQIGHDDQFHAMLRDFEREGWSMERERSRLLVPWEERHRYPQDQRVRPPAEASA